MQNASDADAFFPTHGFSSIFASKRVEISHFFGGENRSEMGEKMTKRGGVCTRTDILFVFFSTSFQNNLKHF